MLRLPVRTVDPSSGSLLTRISVQPARNRQVRTTCQSAVSSAPDDLPFSPLAIWTGNGAGGLSGSRLRRSVYSL